MFAHPEAAYNEELDDLPDPRLYKINVDHLHMYVLLFMAYPERPNPCSCYIYYLRHVDERQHEFQERIDYAWASVDKPNMVQREFSVILSSSLSSTTIV